MPQIRRLLENNKQWSDAKKSEDPDFFQRLAKQQTPEYLWIGCSDSRVPTNQIVGLIPGEVFVHRNVANLVVHTDINCLSVLQYAVDALKVKHIIVCGHYGCGGVEAALQNKELGLIDNWLAHIKDIAEKHREELSTLPEKQRSARLCELNVLAQVKHVTETSIYRDAIARGQDLQVHGLIFGLHNGRLKVLSENSKYQDYDY